MGRGFVIDLSGKTALVTGGCRGIGGEISRQLATAGADIIMNYYHSDVDREAAAILAAELEAGGSRVLLAEADVSSMSEVEIMVENAVREFGHIDILVNNAAISTSAKFHEMSFEVWKQMQDVVLNGAFFVTKNVISHMLRQGSGSIVMITTNCTINGGGGGAHYPAAKAGVEGMSRQLVREYAGNGIRVNIVQPAVIDTDMFRQRYSTDEEVREYGRNIPVGRVGLPVDVANTVVFLSSDKASYICGANLLCDGGRTYYKG